MKSVTIIAAFYVIFASLLGWTYSLQRIVGGKETTIEKHPYQVSLMVIIKKIQHICGGSLITTKFVLTAAHCGDLECYFPNVYAGFGSSFYAKGSKVRVDRWIDHPNFDITTNNNDIAIVRLMKDVGEMLGTKTAIVPLATNDDLVDGSLLTASGWGRQVVGGPPSEILKKVDLPVYNFRECQKLGQQFKINVTENQFCLGGIRDVIKNSCEGDSGGPVVKDGIQYGVISYRISKPCDDDYPQVYTKVSNYHDWIMENVMN